MAGTELNRRLSTQDASFLYFERPNQPLHLGSCLIYKGKVSRADVIQILGARMHLLPRYRQRVVFPPFGIAHPTWEDDAEFDLANHVEEVTLPSPGDDLALSTTGGTVFAQILDRRRPLWKMVLLHGRADGNTAAIMMVHHAMVDGLSGVDLMLVISDLKPDASPPAPPAETWQPQPLPDPLTLLQDAVRDRLTRAAQWWAEESFRYLRPLEAGAQARQINRAMAGSMPSLLQPAPKVPFNGPLSGRRQFAWVPVPFAAVRGIRGVFGGTVNDTVLAIVSGGLGRYLRAHGHSTEGMELRAMCPVSMRREEEHGALGNLVSMMIAPLYVGIIDPVERLAAERAAMDRLKQEDQAGTLYSLMALAENLPPAWQAAAGLIDVPNTMLNTVSTNVPGPQIPLYLGGHRLLEWYPLGPLATGIGLFVAILTYNQTLTFGLTVDPLRVPDVWFAAQCLRESFDELQAAAERAGEVRSPAPAVEPPRGNGYQSRAARRPRAERPVAARR